RLAAHPRSDLLSARLLRLHLLTMGCENRSNCSTLAGVRESCGLLAAERRGDQEMPAGDAALPTQTPRAAVHERDREGLISSLLAFSGSIYSPWAVRTAATAAHSRAFVRAAGC
ncbi:hypothetical protein PMAYCL1PPCAC_10922, partial [Pristionchus mayeri]